MLLRNLTPTHQQVESTSPPLETRWASDSLVNNRMHGSDAVQLQREAIKGSELNSLPRTLTPHVSILMASCCEEAQTPDMEKAHGCEVREISS